MSQALFQRWIDGETGAFEALYRVYYPLILRFATALTGNSSEGEDLAQETFLRLHRTGDQLRQEGISNGRALVYTIARRLAYRSSAYRARWEQLSFHQEEVQQALMASARSSPDELLDAAETGVYIQQAIDSLPEPQREVILLRHHENLSYEEMARILRCSVPQLKARLHYARRLLRGRLQRLGLVPHSR